MSQAITVKTERIHERISTSDGNELLAYTVDTPIIDGSEHFNSFYEKVRDNLLVFCREKLPARCSQGYLYSYRHTCKTHAVNNVLTVTLKTVFTDKTSRRIISSHTETHKWELDKMRITVLK